MTLFAVARKCGARGEPGALATGAARRAPSTRGARANRTRRQIVSGSRGASRESHDVAAGASCPLYAWVSDRIVVFFGVHFSLRLFALRSSSARLNLPEITALSVNF